jgi:TolB protein
MQRAILLLVTVLVGASPASAQIRIDISSPSARAFPLAIDHLETLDKTDPEVVKLVDDTLWANLELSGLFSLVKRKAYLEDLTAGFKLGEFRFEDWEAIGAAAVAKLQLSARSRQLRAELRLYDVQGASMIGGKVIEAPVDRPQVLGDRLADAIFEMLTGEAGMFDTRIAAIQVIDGHKEVVVVSARGEVLERVTRDGSITLSPAWWPDGRSLCYTSFVGGNPDLYLWRDGKASAFSTRPGINSGAAVRPDGQQVALSLSKDGDSEIYLLDPDGKYPVRVTNSWGIDVSPEWSPDGSKIAFVSGRNGSPQIFVLDLASGNTVRLTTAGRHNVAPAWSPDGQRIAFSARDEGRFDIFVVNADGTGLRRLTQSGGNDEDPSWAPNGRYLVFSSSRDGGQKLWITDDEGRHQRALTNGGTWSNPTWGPRLSSP